MPRSSPDGNPDWIVPQWPAPAHVRAVFTTRAGGVSEGEAFASLNLGLVPGDAPSAVQANRSCVARALGAVPAWLSQVHGVHCAVLDATSAAAVPAIEADACATLLPGVPCVMRVADCLPVLFTDGAGTVVAAAHAGWRGLAQGVLEHAVGTLQRLRGASQGAAHELMAWLGPCIGPQAFEVGPEVREAFLARDAAAGSCFAPLSGGKWLADLQALARQRLQAQGITSLHGNDGSPRWCTVSNPSRFFSHRRDQRVLGGSGRMAACIWRDGTAL